MNSTVKQSDLQLPHFKNAKVLVIGDIFLDRYWFGETHRISPEAPVPVIQMNEAENRPGGAGNVAMNLAALGVETFLMAAVGKDVEAETLHLQLEKAGINHYFQMTNYSTITKTRILSQNQQLIRLDHETYLDQLDFELFLKKYQEIVSNFNGVIVSDYCKGTIKNPQALIKIAHQFNVPVFVDPKNKDFSVYQGADLLTPNRKEFENAIGKFASTAELETTAQNALTRYQFKNLLVTRGSEGMTLFQTNQPLIHLPARAFAVKDVTGAGDTVIAVLAAALAAGDSVINAMKLSNIAAGIVVKKLGTAVVSEFELRQAVHEQQSQIGILSLEKAVQVREEARRLGKKIVFTNGCFDILHPGHIGYLEAAKALGDILWVAVNDDDSVSRLKGPSRPAQPLKDRMAVLSALRSVDGVLSFSEDTPENLIRRLSPDVLVKGVDYSNGEIVGADFVLSQGGEVKRVGPEKRWASTDILKKIAEAL